MKHNNIFHKSIVPAILFALTACVMQPELKSITELGCAQPEITVGSASGRTAFGIVSSSEVSVEIINGDDWVELSDPGSFNGDFSLELRYYSNPGEERMATIRLCCGDRQLDLKLIQEGESGTRFNFVQTNITVPYLSGPCKAELQTDLQSSRIVSSVIYPDGGSWIEEPLDEVKEDGTLIFAVAENDSDRARTAIICLNSYDKVGRSIEARLHVTQETSSASEAIPLSIKDLGTLSLTEGDFSADGILLKNYVISGRVISDNSEGNAAPNRNMSSIIQDLGLCGRTVYLQSGEGDEIRGVKLIFNSSDAVSLKRYDFAQISIGGAVFERHTDPEYFTISGLQASNIVSSEPGSIADVPQRHRKISEVTDNDIHTFLTIDGCCIPFSKGPFVPVDGTRSSIINKYPMTIMDRNGSTAYLLTNTTAAWARDGKGLPVGSSDISGIIVSETCDNFNWNSSLAAADRRLEDYVTGIGDIGRWQIRPQTKAEMAFDEASFCTVLAEWTCYADVVNKGGLTYSASDLREIGPSQDWSQKGPLASSASGIVPQSDGPAWFGAYWFSGSHSDPDLESYYWELEVSTSDLTPANAPLSVQIAAFNCVGADVGAPRYWFLKYSADGENWKTLRASSYSGTDCVQNTAIAEDWTYTVPDYPKNGSYRQYHLPGAKNMSFTLPPEEDLWGREKILIRLMPAKDVSGYDGSRPISYDGYTIQNVRRAVLSYAAIRCNK